MIATRKRMNNTSQSSIRRLVAYLTNEQECQSRVLAVNITHCEAEDPAWAAMEMLAVQQQNHRAKADKTYHLVVSFREGEQPDPDVLTSIEERFCEALGFSEHQRVSVLHGDTENLHLHLAINKIHPEKLTIHEPYCDFKILAKTCLELEQTYALQVDNHIAKQQGRHSAAIDMERASDMESLTGWIQRNCLPELQEATNWKSLHAALGKHGLELKPRGNGFVLASDGLHVKASSVDRGLSKNALEKRLGAFEPLAGNSASTPEKIYICKPMSSSGEKLWQEYTEEEKRRQLHAERQSAYQQEHTEQWEEAYGDFNLRRQLIKQFTSGVLNRIILHKLNRSQLRKQVQQHKQPWLRWLKDKARHREDALEYLQNRFTPRQGYLTGTVKQPLGRPEKVTSKGTRLYAEGIKENKERVLLPNKPKKEELHRILEFTKKHFSHVGVEASAFLSKQIATFQALSLARTQTRDREQGNER